MYFGAEHLIGFFTVFPSAQLYSYLGPEMINVLCFYINITAGTLHTCRHNRAVIFRTELGDCSIQHVDLVKEVYRVDSHPLIQVLALGQDHGKPQIS
jgi:hypothetical protein